MPDDYVRSIIKIHTPSYADNNIIHLTTQQLVPHIRQWGNSSLLDIKYSGSYAKGTVVRGSSDIDLFISLSPDTQETLKEVHKKLCSWMSGKGIAAREQNVSIGLTLNGLSVDLTPGRKQPGNTRDHSIYSHKRQTWQLTNIDKHIDLVKSSGRIEEIKLTKMWRNLNALDFPSFYLEMTVIEALKNRAASQPATNFLTVLDYIRDSLIRTVIYDPANSSNKVSDDLTLEEKTKVAFTARNSRTKQTWGEILW